LGTRVCVIPGKEAQAFMMKRPNNLSDFGSNRKENILHHRYTHGFLTIFWRNVALCSENEMK
jgi:hypothetical protein